jgi:hypothetical protein
MSNGILMVAFGEQYDRLAAYCVAYSRQYTDLPILIVSNLETRDPKWADVSGIEFLTLNFKQDQNREVKTYLVDYTPFDKTLYVDCDAIIQRPGIEGIFDLIIPDRLLLNIYGRWGERTKCPGLYNRAFLRSGTILPINIYYGALVGFMKTEKVVDFFKLWHHYWRENGSGRDMPALACSVKNSGIAVRELKKSDGYFSWVQNSRAIIQHEYGKRIRQLVGCPDFKAYKPFDRVRPRGDFVKARGTR